MLKPRLFCPTNIAGEVIPEVIVGRSGKIQGEKKQAISFSDKCYSFFAVSANHGALAEVGAEGSGYVKVLIARFQGLVGNVIIFPVAGVKQLVEASELQK